MDGDRSRPTAQRNLLLDIEDSLCTTTGINAIPAQGEIDSRYRTFVMDITNTSVAAQKLNHLVRLQSTLGAPTHRVIPSMMPGLHFYTKLADAKQMMQVMQSYVDTDNRRVFLNPCLIKWMTGWFLPWDASLFHPSQLYAAKPQTCRGLNSTYYYAAVTDELPRMGYMDIEWYYDMATPGHNKTIEEINVVATQFVYRLADHFMHIYWPSRFGQHVQQHGDRCFLACTPYAYISCSSRWKNAGSVWKFSYHVTYRCSGGCSFRNFKHLKSYFSLFFSDVRQKSPLLPPGIYCASNLTGVMECVVDPAPYGSNQFMRMVGSRKDSTESGQVPFTICSFTSAVATDPPYNTVLDRHIHTVCDHAPHFRALPELPRLGSADSRAPRVNASSTSSIDLQGATLGNPLPSGDAPTSDPSIQVALASFNAIRVTGVLITPLETPDKGRTYDTLYDVSLCESSTVLVRAIIDMVVATGKSDAFVCEGSYNLWFRVSLVIVRFVKPLETVGWAIWDKFCTFAPRSKHSPASQFRYSVNYIVANPTRVRSLMRELRFILVTACLSHVTIASCLEMFLELCRMHPTLYNAPDHPPMFPCPVHGEKTSVYHHGRLQTIGTSVFYKCTSCDRIDNAEQQRSLYLGDTNIPYSYIFRSKYLGQDTGMMQRFTAFLRPSIVDRQYRDLYVRSNMGTGKSTLLHQVHGILPNSSILLVTNRRALSFDLFRRLSTSIPGLQHYQDFDRTKTPLRLIVQLDSLTKMLDFTVPPFDLVVFEESESLLAYYGAATFHRKRIATLALITDIYRRARRLLVFDADLGDRTIDYLKSIRPSTMVRDICFNLAHPIARKIILYPSDGNSAFSSTLLDHYKRKVKFCVVSNSRAIINTISKLLEPHAMPDCKYTVYTGDCTADDRIEISDCNTTWLNYHVVMWTPVISSGVDFNVEHFETMFICIVNNSSPVREALQQANRVRHLSSSIVHVALNYVEPPTLTNQFNTVADAFAYFDGHTQDMMKLLNDGGRYDPVRHCLDRDDPVTIVLIKNFLETTRSSVRLYKEFTRYYLQHGDVVVSRPTSAAATGSIEYNVEVTASELRDLTRQLAMERSELVASSNSLLVAEEHLLGDADADVTPHQLCNKDLCITYRITAINNPVLVSELIHPSVTDNMRKLLMYLTCCMKDSFFDTYLAQIHRVVTRQPNADMALLDGWDFYSRFFHFYDHPVQLFLHVHPIQQIRSALKCLGFVFGDMTSKPSLSTSKSHITVYNIVRFIRALSPVIPVSPVLQFALTKIRARPSDRPRQVAWNDEALLRTMPLDDGSMLTVAEVGYAKCTRPLFSACLRMFGMAAYSLDAYHQRLRCFYTMAKHMFVDMNMFEFVNVDEARDLLPFIV